MDNQNKPSTTKEVKPKGGMKVDFNNLRRKTCIAYDSLCKKLNYGLLREVEYGTSRNAKKDLDRQGDLLVVAEDIQRHMDDLRQLIGTIAMCYEPGDPDTANVYEELYPEPKSMESFKGDEEG
jgi:hypothetical protein